MLEWLQARGLSEVMLQVASSDKESKKLMTHIQGTALELKNAEVGKALKALTLEPSFTVKHEDDVQLQG